EHARKAEQRVKRDREPQIAAESQDYKIEVELGRPISRRANLPVERSAEEEQCCQTSEELPASQALGFGPPQSPDQGRGRRYLQRVEPEGAPVQPEQDARQV